jgi:hypothetical protein
MDIKQFETLDYQKRGGGFPQSGKPDAITTCHQNRDLCFSFKDTNEEIAKRWVEAFVILHCIPCIDIKVSQAGDYHDDWVEVEVIIKY